MRERMLSEDSQGALLVLSRTAAHLGIGKTCKAIEYALPSFRTIAAS